jgi:REP element-mobilizing transposase RayT
MSVTCSVYSNLASILLHFARMARPLRHMPHPGTAFEITCRCIQGRMLLRPSAELNEIIVGIIGKALTLYPIQLHAITVPSNHMHLILTTPDIKTMARFMNYINSKIAREAGKLHGWREKFWGRRYRAIPILDCQSLVARMKYLLAHGCKEGLVKRPHEWPGVNCVEVLLGGKKLEGTWFDRTAEYNARKEGKTFEQYEFATRYEVVLAPISFWASLNEDERRNRVKDIVDEIESETKERLEKERYGVLGVKEVLAQAPWERPLKMKRSPAPWCHAADGLTRKLYKLVYRKFVEVYQEASERLRRGERNVRFPVHCFPPPLAYTGAFM